MTRDEIRLRALRAAAAVSLTAGLFGCGANIEIDTSSSDPGDEQDAEASSGEGSASASTSASASSSGDTPVEPDAGAEPEDAASPVDATADAQVDCFQAPDYVACCEQQSWSPEAGCMAWGPPMPPAMEVA